MGNKNITDIPYPDPVRLLNLLKNPYTQEILPDSVRRPLTLLPLDQTSSNSTFEKDGFFRPIGKNPLDKIWGSYAEHLGNKFQGTFQGLIREAHFHFPYLEFRMSGYLGEPDLAFILRDEVTGKSVNFKPNQIAGNHWHNFIIPNPSRFVKVEARDNNPDYWFAFMEPVEMGILSRWMHWILPLSKWIFTAGLASLAILIMLLKNLKEE